MAVPAEPDANSLDRVVRGNIRGHAHTRSCCHALKVIGEFFRFPCYGELKGLTGTDLTS